MGVAGRRSPYVRAWKWYLSVLGAELGDGVAKEGDGEADEKNIDRFSINET